ncbi:SDR family oxidoreductase [Sphaerimonospora sp. CA-214678]|uniref:SDR family oxidoreductase n=1 Tax=Sphaerimonospora sp. CA-214678 TaxID=3240029 RepID=UPI003D8E22AA
MSSIAVTGAAGNTGRAVIAALACRGVRTTALVHRDEQKAQAVAAGADRVVAVDYTNRSALSKAIGGVDAVYHVPPNMHPAEDRLTQHMIDIAHECAVKRFVLHSVLAPYLPAMPHHLRKARSEVALRGSDLTWTIMQPGWYAQNLLTQIPRARDEGVINVPHSVSARFTPVDLEDVAEVAATVLTEEGHDFATYELSGPAMLNAHEMAEIVSDVLGIPVRAEEQTIGQWRESAPRLRDGAAEGFEAMFRYYDQHGLTGNPRILTMLLGRAPTDLSTVLARDVGGPPSPGVRSH